jgi:hypothetical protein
MSPNTGGREGSCGVSAAKYMQLYTGAQINFGDPNPYLTYALMHVTSAEGFDMFCIKHERNIDEENNGYVVFK